MVTISAAHFALLDHLVEELRADLGKGDVPYFRHRNEVEARPALQGAPEDLTLPFLDQPRRSGGRGREPHLTLLPRRGDAQARRQ